MLQGRVDVVEADVTQAPPHGSWDVGVLCNVVQVLPRAEAHRALVNVGAAIESGGSLYIFGHALEDSRLAPANAVGMNLAFLSVYDGGQSYTEGEHRAWLAEAGLAEVEVRFGAGPGGGTVIVARKQPAGGEGAAMPQG